ncbi:hypothetical protein GIB67_032662 [Kingdonia uniflora]|uniref:Uncharacterized protein n=1 Tax=Kingdonia uniflora TaxID=39325 RepID=A0A7J7MVW0_9MAGN|nr:hypothetical protein GIB67_032662 [Kingdonia uniflora]
MSAAAKHLTHVTLELGGKCPVIADSRLSPSQMQGESGDFCSGQACIGVDYLLVEDEFAPSLVTFTILNVITILNAVATNCSISASQNNSQSVSYCTSPPAGHLQARITFVA